LLTTGKEINELKQNKKNESIGILKKRVRFQTKLKVHEECGSLICNTDQVLNWSTHLRLREKMLQGKDRINRGYFNLESPFKRKELNFLCTTSVPNASSKKGVRLRTCGTTLGNGEEQHNNQDLLSFKQVKRKLVLPATSVDQFLKKQQIHKEHDIDHDLPNKKEVKKSPYQLLVLIGLKQQGIVIGDERKRG
ncbi:hypothetical protein H5410_040450, partial [Solanum commersonii]